MEKAKLLEPGGEVCFGNCATTGGCVICGVPFSNRNSIYLHLKMQHPREWKELERTDGSARIGYLATMDAFFQPQLEQEGNPYIAINS